MPFTMPRKWQTEQKAAQGVDAARTIYYEGEVYACVNDLRRVVNYRVRLVTDNRYRVAMIWMRDLLKGLLEGNEHD